MKILSSTDSKLRGDRSLHSKGNNMKILSAYVQYNANSDNKRIGDCVIRSISVALQIPYTEVRRELKRYGSPYNSIHVFEPYLKDKCHSTFVQYTKSKYNVGSSITEQEFAELYPNGTYLLLVASPRAKSNYNHLVAIVDGDIYDSWDSSNSPIYAILTVKEESSDKFETASIQQVADDILEEVYPYIDNLSNKYKYVALRCISDWRVVDNYTITSTWASRISSEAADTFSGYEDARGRTLQQKKFVIKLNPRLSQEDNVKTNINFLKSQFREFAYSTNKQFADMEKRIKSSGLIHDRFTGDEQVLLSLPKNVIPFITYLNYWPDAYYEKYIVEGVPCSNDIVDTRWQFGADTYREMKSWLVEYAKTGERVWMNK